MPLPSGDRRPSTRRTTRAFLLLLSLSGMHGASAQETVPRGPRAPATAESAISLEGWQARERRLRAAIRLNPGEAAFHASLAEALAQQGRPSEALEAYRQAVERAPRVTEYRLAYAGALVAAGRAQEGEAQLRAAVRLDPQAAPIRAALGEVLLRAGRAEEGARELERAAELDPARPEYRDLAREARRSARWSWLDGAAASGGAAVATRALRALAAAILVLAGLALLLPLLGAIFLVLVATPLAMLRGRARRTLRPR